MESGTLKVQYRGQVEVYCLGLSCVNSTLNMAVIDQRGATQ